MNKRWIAATPPDDKLADELSHSLSIEKPLAKLLIARGITSVEP